MITILRKIRKSLIESGRVSKYLIYALGEILLVVIGILIALQINNWNETRKEKIIEKQYFTNLVSDLDGQIEVCNTIIKAEKIKGNLADIALNIIVKNEYNGKLQLLDSLLNRLTPRRTFTAYNATFEDLKSSGNIKLIKDYNLRKAITDYYHNVKNMSRVFALNNADLDTNYKTSINQNKFMFYKDKSGKLRNDNLKDPIIRETMVRLVKQKKFISNLHNRRLNDIIESSQELRSLIKEKI